jgi:hypothetical protein
MNKLQLLLKIAILVLTVRNAVYKINNVIRVTNFFSKKGVNNVHKTSS